MKKKWTREKYLEVAAYINKPGMNVAQASKDLKFSVGNFYKYKKIYATASGLFKKRTYTKKAKTEKTAFIDLETATPANNQVAIIMVSTSNLKAVMGALWQ